MSMRVGIGYDIHRFREGKGSLKLGGVAIPHARGLEGHSDADVLLHAVADALLGAIGSPDLGELFPTTDPRWKRADSRRFVREAYARVRKAGWRVGNLDTTVIADSPKLTPHKAKMCRAISRLLDLEPSDVSVKAKTTEGLPPGDDGIAAQAVVLLTRHPANGRTPSPQGLGRGRSR